MDTNDADLRQADANMEERLKKEGIPHPAIQQIIQESRIGIAKKEKAEEMMHHFLELMQEGGLETFMDEITQEPDSMAKFLEYFDDTHWYEQIILCIFKAHDNILFWFEYNINNNNRHKLDKLGSWMTRFLSAFKNEDDKRQKTFVEEAQKKKNEQLAEIQAAVDLARADAISKRELAEVSTRAAHEADKRLREVLSQMTDLQSPVPSLSASATTTLPKNTKTNAGGGAGSAYQRQTVESPSSLSSSSSSAGVAKKRIQMINSFDLDRFEGGGGGVEGSRFKHPKTKNGGENSFGAAASNDEDEAKPTAINPLSLPRRKRLDTGDGGSAMDDDADDDDKLALSMHMFDELNRNSYFTTHPREFYQVTPINSIQFERMKKRIPFSGV